MHRITRAPVLFLLAIALIVPVAPCARGPDGSVAPVSRDTIVVGSKGFTEQEVVAEIVAQAIERRTDARVERRLRLGDANICHAALLAGDIDVYVEYTGVGLAMLGAGRTPDVSGDFAALLRGYEERFGLEWAPLLGFDTRDVVAVPGAAASEHGWARISDLGSAADGIILVCTPEFFLRDEGYKALSEAYGFRFAKVVSIAPEHRKIALGTGQLYAFVTHATDPGIASLGLRVLGDDRGHFMPYAAAPVVRGAVLGAHPGLHDVVDHRLARGGLRVVVPLALRFKGDSSVVGPLE